MIDSRVVDVDLLTASCTLVFLMQPIHTTFQAVTINTVYPNNIS